MYILIFWITCYGNHISTTSAVTLDSREQCIYALESLQSKADTNLYVSGLCLKK